MNKKIFVLIITFGVIMAGVSISNLAFSDANSGELKIATVDLSALITNSQSVQTLKVTHEKQLDEIENMLEQARKEISAESDPVKIAQLEEKYRKDVSSKKLEMDKNYNDKLLEIDKNIKNQVAMRAKELHYNIVLPKNLVLYGGEDITSVIAKDIK